MINAFDGVVVLVIFLICWIASRVPVIVNLFIALGCSAGVYVAAHYPTASENGMAGVFLGFTVAGILVGLFVNHMLPVPLPDIVKRIFGYIAGIFIAAAVILVMVLPVAGRLSARNTKLITRSLVQTKIIVPAQKKYPLLKQFDVTNFKEAGLPGIMKSLGFNTEPTAKLIEKSKARMHKDWEQAERVNPEKE